MIKVIVFDCWNTLFYKDLQPRPFTLFAKKLGKDIRDYSYLKTFEECFMLEDNENYIKPINKILKKLNIKKSSEEINQLVKILNKNKHLAKPFEEVIEVLKDLKQRYVLCILSNADPIGFHSLEEDFDLSNYFSHVITSFKLGYLKPNPKLFQKLMDLNNVKKDEVIMVGDSLKDDILSAERFGIKGILLDRNNKHGEYPNRINSLKEIYNYLN